MPYLPTVRALDISDDDATSSYPGAAYAVSVHIKIITAVIAAAVTTAAINKVSKTRAVSVPATAAVFFSAPNIDVSPGTPDIDVCPVSCFCNCLFP